MSDALAMLIDADNISASHGAEIFEIAGQLGDLVAKEAFGAMSVFQGKDSWRDVVRYYAIEAFPQVNHLDRKNAADFALLIHAMDGMASGKYDGFVIVSSDSDFTSLAQRLRRERKLVYGIGDSRAPLCFRHACTRFFELTAPLPEPSAPASKDSGPRCPASPAVEASSHPEARSALPSDYFRVKAMLCKINFKKRSSLENYLRKTLKRSEEETKAIIQEMIAQGILEVNEETKIITWRNRQ